MNEEERDLRTEHLGRFDELEVQIVVDILGAHDIKAWPKLAFEHNETTVYPGLQHEKGEVLVEAGKVDEAWSIIEQELPAHLSAIETSMGSLDVVEPDDTEG